jgi:hypothetical protein
MPGWEFTTLVDSGSFFDGPRWHEGRWWVSDLCSHLVPEGLGVFTCMLGGDDGRTLLLCTAPAFFDQAGRQPREAVLLTTRLELPPAGLP